MKFRFTYKELTLILGVIVALLVFMTLWFNPILAENNDQHSEAIPSLIPAAKIVIDKIVLSLF